MASVKPCLFTLYEDWLRILIGEEPLPSPFGDYAIDHIPQPPTRGVSVGRKVDVKNVVDLLNGGDLQVGGESIVKLSQKEHGGKIDW